MKKLTGSKFGVAQVAALVVAATAIVGCQNMTAGKIDSYGKIADAYYTAPNMATLWVIENTNSGQVCKFEVSNFTRFEMNTPVPPKNILPREPTFTESLFDFAKVAAPYAFMGYIFGSGNLGGNSSSSTTVTQPAAAAAATP